jgi:AcrR family transcriptional regulator
VPRPLDLEQRKADIARIAFEVMGRGGPSGLTIRAVAEELGGSVTKVTHIYPTRAELMRASVERYVSEGLAAPPETEAPGDSPWERVRARLRLMMPFDDADLRLQRGRVAILGDKDQDSARIFADGIEQVARAWLMEVLEPTVEPERLEEAIDFCRAFVNGVVLGKIEHPDYWSSERMERTLDTALQAVSTMRPPDQQQAS